MKLVKLWTQTPGLLKQLNIIRNNHQGVVILVPITLQGGAGLLQATWSHSIAQLQSTRLGVAEQQWSDEPFKVGNVYQYILPSAPLEYVQIFYVKMYQDPAVVYNLTPKNLMPQTLWKRKTRITVSLTTHAAEKIFQNPSNRWNLHPWSVVFPKQTWCAFGSKP